MFNNDYYYRPVHLFVNVIYRIYYILCETGGQPNGICEELGDASDKTLKITSIVKQYRLKNPLQDARTGMLYVFEIWRPTVLIWATLFLSNFTATHERLHHAPVAGFMRFCWGTGTVLGGGAWFICSRAFRGSCHVVDWSRWLKDNNTAPQREVRLRGQDWLCFSWCARLPAVTGKGRRPPMSWVLDPWSRCLEMLLIWIHSKPKWIKASAYKNTSSKWSLIDSGFKGYPAWLPIGSIKALCHLLNLLSLLT